MTKTTEIVEFFADASMFGARRHFLLGNGHGSYAYLRKNYRRVGSAVMHCLVLADVGIAPEEQRKGVFSALLADCTCAAEQLGCDALYAECVVSTIAANALERRGFKRIDIDAQTDYVLTMP